MRADAIITVLFLAACGDDIECSVADRDGLYLFEYAVTSGDCTPPGSSLVSLNNGAWDVGSDCTETGNFTSSNECLTTRYITCIDDTSDRSANLTYAIRQDGADTDRLGRSEEH